MLSVSWICDLLLLYCIYMFSNMSQDKEIWGDWTWRLNPLHLILSLGESAWSSNQPVGKFTLRQKHIYEFGYCVYSFSLVIMFFWCPLPIFMPIIIDRCFFIYSCSASHVEGLWEWSNWSKYVYRGLSLWFCWWDCNCLFIPSFNDSFTPQTRDRDWWCTRF